MSRSVTQLLFFLLILLQMSSCSKSEKKIDNQIILNPSMIINESAIGDAGFLIDEQNTFGESPEREWEMKNEEFQITPVNTVYPLTAVIDLGKEYSISNLHYYDNSNHGNITFSYGKPFEWKTLLTSELDDKGWVKNQLANITTRYIHIETKDENVPVEIILQGVLSEKTFQLTSQETATPAPAIRPLPTMDQFIGTNAFITDPIGLMQMGSIIREYHVWPGWNEPEDDKLVFNPTSQGWDFDAYYRNLKKAGIFVFPCINNSPEWLTGSIQAEDKPILPNADPNLPESYAQKASFMFQYAARYGSGNVSDEQLLLAPGQPRSKNLGLLTHYENWNEQDKNWLTEKAYFAPYHYAAMSSADYDGNQGKMKGNYGIKNADPNAKMVMSGLAFLNLDYIKALKFWSDHNRNGDFPWDVINLHHYCNAGGDLLTTGESPEDHHFKEKIKKIVEYRNQFLPDKELWISEFGYDVYPKSKQKSPKIGLMPAEEVQAIWNIRSFLALAAAGIDKATHYMIRDGDNGPQDQYATSGASFQHHVNGEWVRGRRPSWFYIHTMKNRLAGMRFNNEGISGNEKVLIYKFQSASKPNLRAYAVWCKTSNDSKVNNFNLKLAAGETVAQLITLEDKDYDGKETPLIVKNGSVAVNVSEKPIFVIVNNAPILHTFAAEQKLTLTPKMVVNEGTDNADALVDEQNLVGDPDLGNAPLKPAKGWNPDWSKNYELSAYLDLGKEYEVSKVYINDGPGEGLLTISTGTPGNWTKQSDDTMLGYQQWKGHVINTKTRYIRFSRASKSVGVFEVGIYIKP